MKHLWARKRALDLLVRGCNHGDRGHPSIGPLMSWFKCLSTTPQSIDLNSASYILWGAGTDVGKTLVATGLAYTATSKMERFLYIKPVQTGFPESCDSKTVAASCGGGVSYGPHAQHFPGAAPISNRGVVQCHTLFAWEKATSPHLAAKSDERDCVKDETIINETAKTLTYATGEHGMAIVETAGGVCSPFPSETLQCDALRQIRLPSILVADSKLGGISATLTAYDSLLIRGFDVVAVVLTVNPQLDNAEYISHNLRKHVHWIGGQRPVVVVLPELPKQSNDPEEHQKFLTDWLEEAKAPLDEFSEELKNMYTRRCAKLRYTIYEASEALWWPFTQHKTVEKEDLAVFDSRWGDNLAVVRPLPFKQWKMQPQFDACASWWTQGMGADMQPEMARAVAYAAGRYGHVLFPECVHDAVLQCSKKLLATVGRPWASRVFYSDNGSTAVEVAIKMGLRLFLAHNRQSIHDEDQMKILGFRNSYHGDTLGAMEATPPSVYNKNQFPWYRDQGVFITPPALSFTKGQWIVQIPDDWPGDAVRKVPGLTRSWKVNLSEPSSSREKDFRQLYSTLVNNVIDASGAEENDTHGKNHIASMLMEPVMQGAGGMVLVDPLFQQEAIKACQERGIPVILDEVFTGFWRVGAISGAELLAVHPDIACFAKLFTGGIVPMSVTITGKAAFKAFWGKYKTNALLHGHSFTAHPVGCVAACTAMDIMNDPKFNPNLVTRMDQEENHTQDQGPSPQPSCIPYLQQNPISGSLTPLWDDDLVIELSNHWKLQGVVAIGTVFAATLKPDEEEVTGYRSNRAREVTRRLRLRGVFARPLGDVVYLMVGVTTPRSVCTRLLTILKQELDVKTKG